MIPGLYQQNTLSSVAYQTVDSDNKLMNQRLYPKLKIVLSLDEFKTKNEGTQDKMDETLRKDIEKKMEERKAEREKERENRGRGGYRRGRGGFKSRGGFRGRRGGFR
jgi:hypothetical protein